jgi:hypothetical protein
MMPAVRRKNVVRCSVRELVMQAKRGYAVARRSAEFLGKLEVKAMRWLVVVRCSVRELVIQAVRLYIVVRCSVGELVMLEARR